MKSQPAWIVILSALFFFCAPARSDDALPPPAKRPLVFQIPIRGQIEPALLYVLRRGVTEATKHKADAVVFIMDTPGGSVKETREIMGLIGKINVPVYTFIEKDAYSAGAIIALSTPRIYMAPSSVIGAATPLMMGPLGGVEEMSEAVEEKMTSAVAALVRAAAEQGGHDPQIGEAMVRRELGYTSGTNVLCKAGELLTLTAREAEGILSEGTVENVEEMLERAGLAKAEIRELAVTPAERVARWIAALAPILLLLGLGGIYLEIKTPGFGLPGLTGIAALTLFFFGHHLAGLAGFEDMLLFTVGVILLVIEIFVTPGFGVLGLSGMALMLAALLSAMSWQAPGELLPTVNDGTLRRAILNLALAGVGLVVFGIAAEKYLPSARLIRPLLLAPRAVADEKPPAVPVGVEGRAETCLRPAGRALFGEQRIDVITQGEFIDSGATVRVIKARGNRIVVEKV
jgi:membrane-bound serine protease (ClpP class)